MGFIIGLVLVAAGGAAFGQTAQEIAQCVNKNKAYTAEQSSTACTLVGSALHSRAYDREQARDYAGAAADHETSPSSSSR
jgi:hypothetical protein